MIDTVVLTLKQNEFKVLDWSKFRKEVVRSKDPYTKYILISNNKIEGYKPQLTIYDRFGITARIQFSVPKVLFNGSNIDEAIDGDFSMLVRKLSILYGSMYIAVTPDQLRNTEVSAIHYSKNIIFTDYTTSSMILNELEKIEISAKLDQDTKDFKNNGQRLLYHSNTWELCFYDKRKEFEQHKKYGKKRTDEEGFMQLDLLDKISIDPLEIFRIEYRLNEKRKIRETLSKYGFNTDLKFESMFKREISRKFLIGIWKLFEDKLDYTLHNTKDPISLLEGVFNVKPDISLLKALAYAMSFNIASSEDGGIKRFKDCIVKFSNRRSWYRIKKQLKEIGLSPTKTKLEALLQISQKLEEFNAVKLEDYPQLDHLKCK